jgi:hypothetical protein
MGDLVRILNDEGIRKFRQYLADLRAGSTSSPPKDILADSWCSAKLPINIEIENQIFEARLGVAKYFSRILRPLGYSKLEQNVGLWTWLSLYYFDQVCPISKTGKRIPGLDYRYILDIDFRFYYRHNLFGSYIVYLLHGEGAPLLLYNPLSQTNKFHLELACRQGFITNKGIIEAANSLYFDDNRAIPKRGAAVTSRKLGTLFRFIDVVQQLDLNFDLHSMTGKQVLDLLPPEFTEWKE